MVFNNVGFIFIKSKTKLTIETKSDLHNQVLWGNHLLKYKGKCLYSNQMIHSNFIFVNDILQQNGVLKTSIYDGLKDKRNYFSDLGKIIKAIEPYKVQRFSTDNIEECNIDTTNKGLFFVKSKLFYEKLVLEKVQDPVCSNYWQKELGCFDYRIFYKQKLKFLYISKVKEFIFKLIHNICPCREKLKIWKISDIESCPYCQAPKHNVKHMMWECQDVNNLWNIVTNHLNIEMCYKVIILGSDNIKINNLVSVIMYCIYKKFIIDNNRDQNQPESLKAYIVPELVKKAKLYEQVEACASLYHPLIQIADVIDDLYI